MNKIFFVWATVLIVLLIFVQAGAVSDFYFTQGIVMPGGAGNIADYYITGYEGSLGMKLPASLIKGWVQSWLDFGYGYLPFDRNSEFPVFYRYSTPPKMRGKGTNLFSLAVDLQVISPKPGRFHDYFLFGLGFMKRTKLSINTNSPEYPHFETSYKTAAFFSFGLGLNFRINDRLLVFTDIQYAVANTTPAKTAFAPFRLGLIFHYPKNDK